MPCQAFLVALLDGGPLFSELLVFSESKETFKFVQVLKPNILLGLKSLGDEITEFEVALIEPATRGD